MALVTNVLSKRRSISERDQFFITTHEIIEDVNRRKTNVELIYLEQLRERNIAKYSETNWEVYLK
jgi:hypothetical protein